MSGHLPAIRAVLAAYRSTSATITREQITAAWTEYEATRRAVAGSVIEHEIDWCDTFECDGPATEDPEYEGTCDDCGAGLVRVKVVRADAYRRAVDEHRAFVAALTEALTEHGVPATVSWRAAVDWLAANGGTE